MAKGKHLSKEDLEDVNTWEDLSKPKIGNGGIRINDVRLSVKCLNEKQKELKKAIEEKEIVICVGPAGGGKTYLSLLTALHLLKIEPKYKKIVLIKSLQTIKGEEVGTLPGTLQEKLNPYMNSFTSNLDKIFGSKAVTHQLIENGTIEIVPIAYIRGITFDDSIIVCDETQNINTGTFRTLITRIGSNSKIVFLGDVQQCDFIDKDKSCLTNVFNLFKNESYAKCVQFLEDDCVRNPLIPKILRILGKK